jgi:hypothetical protein
LKKLLLLPALCCASVLSAQLNIDTLAFQDFEIAPAAPTWAFTGPVIYNSGFSGPSATPANSPIGIGGSRAWETTVNSAGLVLNFANTMIPAGYDSIRVRFNLAAMNLNGTTGGPDNLDYVLIAYSTDGGTTYFSRLRIRGAVTDNCSWAYSATAVAKVYYQPTTEQMFQPSTSGLQTTEGYSTCEIVFPGTVTQIAYRITARSSSSSDTWLIDNLVMTGENNCTSSTSAFSASACGSYTTPSGNVLSSSGTYLDTITNSTGCDSVITINLTVNPASASSMSVNACNSYTSPSGNVITTSGMFMDTIPNALGCDSVITINLTVNSASASSMSVNACNSYTSPSGNVITTSGMFMDTIPNTAGCDSVITINATINSSSSFSQTVTACFSYNSPSGNTYTTSGTYADTIPNAAGCDSVITTQLTIDTVDIQTSLTGATLMANATGATYQWIDCNNGNAPIAGETNQTFSPTVNGNYAVIITQNSCTDTSACTMVLSVGIVESHIGFIVAPNPGAGLLNISGRFVNASVTITDAQGKVCMYENSVNGTMMNADITAQPAGVYFVQIVNEQETSRIRIVKY